MDRVSLRDSHMGSCCETAPAELCTPFSGSLKDLTGETKFGTLAGNHVEACVLA